MCVCVCFFFGNSPFRNTMVPCPKNIVINEYLFILCIDYYRCQKALDAKGVDTAPCDWYKRVYKSLCPLSWVNIPSSPIAVSIRIVQKDHLLSTFSCFAQIEKWDTQMEDGTFPGKIWRWHILQSTASGEPKCICLWYRLTPAEQGLINVCPKMLLSGWRMR